MDDYDYQGEWDAFDTQDFDSLGDTTAYQGMGNDYGYGQSYQPAEQMQQPWENPNYTIGSDGTQFWRDQAGMDIGYMSQGGEFTPYQGMQQQNMQQPGMDWAGMGKSSLDALGQLFKGGSGGSTSTFLKGLAGLYAANQEKKSNQYMANQIPQQVNSLRQFAAPYDVASTGAGMMTPGATTMRDAAMQQAAQRNQRLLDFRANPNSDAGYKATHDMILETARRRAAASGNRMTPFAEEGALSPATLAALAQNQLAYDKNYQNDLNSWDVRSGANINPTQVGGLEALLQATKYDTLAKSPASYMDVIGKILNTNSYESNPQIAELIAAINKAKV